LVDKDKAVWVDETLAERPRDIYDITKQTTEAALPRLFL
jgi:UDP-glucose 4-epimerase